jgi:hypothetical protein
MSDVNTFDSSSTPNPTYEQQKQGVSKMREALLASADGTMTVSTAMQRVTALRIFHQMNRVIQYTEMMDKLEAKLYEAMDFAITATDITNRHDMLILVGLQERLQKNFLDSQKMLQPYIEMGEAFKNYVEYTEDNDILKDQLASPDGREHIRIAAQRVIKQLAG